jgi:outer membrane protein OmpA-like peptidoglycan-associated protein
MTQRLNTLQADSARTRRNAMFNYVAAGLILMCLFNVAAHADTRADAPNAWKEPAGFGLGALLGGLIGGPPGAIVGAAGGAWLGSRSRTGDEQLVALERRLEERELEFAALRSQLADLHTRHAGELQRVRLERRQSVLEQLSDGVTLTVYFRTDSPVIDGEFIPRIQSLAEFLYGFPEIRLDLEGHADRRGAVPYNEDLSRKRALAVRDALVRAGLAEDRLRARGVGSAQARAAQGDADGHAFDRRVTIRLTIDTEV